MARRLLPRRFPDAATLANYFLVLIIYAALSTLFLFIVTYDGPLGFFDDVYSYESRNIMKVPPLSREEIANISTLIRDLNEQQLVYNLDIYGPLTKDTKVIVIQAHTRIRYIAALLESLSNCWGINDSLLIFSHDVYMPSMNDMIRNITFTRVLQIFYPHSLQLHPDHFPGPDPDDLQYGSDWSPKLAQIKLHWWWKQNFVFDQIKILRNFTSVISFTDEDTYFTPDAFWMLKLMEESMIKNECEGCEILSIAENEAVGTVVLRHMSVWRWQYPDTDYSKGIISPRPSILHFAINRTVWEKVQKCSEMFCNYNDYNFDWTLVHLMTSRSCMRYPLKSFVLLWPRLFHIGGCGTHRAAMSCDPSVYVRRVKKMSKNYAFLFAPELGKLDVRFISRRELKAEKNFGGMGNPKVGKFCMSMVHGGVDGFGSEMENLERTKGLEMK